MLDAHLPARLGQDPGALGHHLDPVNVREQVYQPLERSIQISTIVMRRLQVLEVFGKNVEILVKSSLIFLLAVLFAIQPHFGFFCLRHNYSPLVDCFGYFICHKTCHLPTQFFRQEAPPQVSRGAAADSPQTFCDLLDDSGGRLRAQMQPGAL